MVLKVPKHTFFKLSACGGNLVVIITDLVETFPADQSKVVSKVAQFRHIGTGYMSVFHRIWTKCFNTRVALPNRPNLRKTNAAMHKPLHNYINHGYIFTRQNFENEKQTFLNEKKCNTWNKKSKTKTRFFKTEFLYWLKRNQIY